MENTSLTGVVLRVYQQKTGTSNNGKPWSVQRFKLGTEDGKECFNVEVWGEPDLAGLKGKTVRCFGSHVEDQYEGKTYAKFRTDCAPQPINANGNGKGDPADSAANTGGTSSHDSLQINLLQAVALLTQCHDIARGAELTPDDGRALFAACVRFSAVTKS